VPRGYGLPNPWFVRVKASIIFEPGISMLSVNGEGVSAPILSIKNKI